MNQVSWKFIYKISFGLLALSSIITEIIVLITRDKFNPINFFSYFTIESNLLVAIVLLASAVALRLGKNDKLDNIRGAITVYISIVGIGFSVLLAGMENVEFTAVAWDNLVLHYIMPIAVLIDFVWDRPRKKMEFSRSISWMIFPAIYLCYTLIRGPFAMWYPYPFLNPSTSGNVMVGISIIGMSILGLALIWVVCRLSGEHSLFGVQKLKPDDTKNNS